MATKLRDFKDNGLLLAVSELEQLLESTLLDKPTWRRVYALFAELRTHNFRHQALIAELNSLIDNVGLVALSAQASRDSAVKTATQRQAASRATAARAADTDAAWIRLNELLAPYATGELKAMLATNDAATREAYLTRGAHPRDERATVFELLERDLTLTPRSSKKQLARQAEALELLRQLLRR